MWLSAHSTPPTSLWNDEILTLALANPLQAGSGQVRTAAPAVRPAQSPAGADATRVRALTACSDFLTPSTQVCSLPRLSALVAVARAEMVAGFPSGRLFLEFCRTGDGRKPWTLKWYAIKIGPGKFGIFDTFANEAGRNAHLTGEIAKALGARANELFATPPQVEKVEILASTPLKN